MPDLNLAGTDVGGVVGGVGEKVKKVPPIVWLILAGVVIAFIVLRRGGGSSSGTAATVTGSPGGSGGDFSPDQGQQITDLAAELHQDVADLNASIADQNASNAAFQSTVTDMINNIPKPTTGGTTGGTGGSTGGTHAVVSKFKVSLTTPHTLYNASHKQIGSVTKASYILQKGQSHGGGYYWYKIIGTQSGAKSANIGKYILLKPSQVKPG